jgi:1-acyl-sn-glycerol-3-phosphate acyltransferase
MDLARVARGLESAAAFAAHGGITPADVTSVERVVQHADRALWRTGELLAGIDGARRGGELLKEARAYLTRGGNLTAFARELGEHAFADGMASVAPELRSAAARIRGAATMLDAVEGVTRLTDETSTLLLRGAERDAALAEAATRTASGASHVVGADAAYVHARVGGVQGALTGVVKGALRTVFRVEHHGAERVPRTGAVLLLGTHGTDLDSVYVAAGANRRVRFMAAKEVLDATRPFDRLLRKLGAFPIDRGGGAASEPGKRIARTLLERGEAVQMFPDGGIVRLPSGIVEPKAGAALLALQTGAPVVPSASFGLQAARARVGVEGAGRHVLYGEPLVFRRVADPTYEQISEVRELIAQHTERLADQARSRYRAG